MNVGLLMTTFELTGGDRHDQWAMARHAERLGFDSLWAGEHHLVPASSTSVNAYHGAVPPPVPACLVRLAGVAAATSTIRIGTAILLLPQHHPVLLAKELATLDRDSGGRLIVGVGVGWNREEVDVMGGNWEHRATQTRESVEVMTKLWTAEFVDHAGHFYRFGSILSAPGPLQRPRPPILLGMHTDKTPARVAAYGDGWLESVTQPDRVAGDGVAHIERCLRSLEDACRVVDRDPSTVTLTVILNDAPESAVDRSVVRRYLDVGAERVVLLGSRADDHPFETVDEGIGWLEDLAARVLA